MSKIVAISKSKTVEQQDKQLNYFQNTVNISKLRDYSILINKIQSANEMICIAATGGINSKIIEKLYTPIAKGVRVYIILDSFNAATLIKFNDKTPAIIREVPELQNNFVITDNEATLFVNSLANHSNIKVELSEKQYEDINYWFNYYFWNKADKEKILDKLSTPKESPFPPFKTEKETVNLASSDIDNFQSIIVPQNNKHENLADNADKFYFSKDVNVPLYFSKQVLIIGNLKLDVSINVGELWEFKETSLQEINSEIIPFDGNWANIENILDEKTVPLSDMRAETIENMDKTEHSQLPDEIYTKNVIYTWKVLPPVKPSNAKEARLYKEYDSVQQQFVNDLNELKRVLEQIQNRKSSVIDFFFGTKRKAAQHLKTIKSYMVIVLKSLPRTELNDLLGSQGEFQKFFKSVVDFKQRFENEIDKKEKEHQWKENKAKKESELNDKKSELSQLTKEIESLETENTKLNKSIKNKKKTLDKKFSKCKSEIKSLEAEIEKKYKSFKYISNGNELDNLKSSKKTSLKLNDFKLPEYPLPEVGKLFENNTNYYLEIESYSELYKANEIAQKRYIDKPTKVVVKEA
jgi:hypothetical protein